MEFHPRGLMTSLGGGGCTHAAGPQHAGHWAQHGGEQVGISTQPPQVSLVQSASVHLSDLRDGEMAWWLRVTTSAGVAFPSLRGASTARLRS